MKYTIILVEDEVNLNNIVKTYLEKAGYNVVSFYNGTDALNGYDIIKKIREHNDVIPVIFTSARDKDLDKIIGLELGSDDYIAKPYSPKELVLRVGNIIKRVYSSDLSKIKYNNYLIALDKRIVSLNNENLNLTTLEFDLLKMFLTNKNKSFSRDDILNIIWGENYFGTDRVVDDLVRRLRRKMPDLNIETMYGYGYRLTWKNYP